MLINTPEQLRQLDRNALHRPAPTRRVMLCPPDHFQVLDVHNAHMAGQRGAVDPQRAAVEWNSLRGALEALDLGIVTLAPQPDLPDQVFVANPCLAGLDRAGRPLVLISRMRYPSRQPEVALHRAWALAEHARIVELPDAVSGTFEGGGDGIWHPDTWLLWGGVGPRTEQTVYEHLARELDLPIALLRLVDERFYHLDTCLAVIDPRRAAIVRSAFDPAGLALLEAGFEQLIAVDEDEARTRLAGNLYCPNGRDVLLPSNAPITRRRLEAAGLTVHEIATDEFLKSGGSIYCMRQGLPF